MLLHPKFLLLVLTYGITQLVWAESAKSDAEAVLTEVLGEIRSKIVELKNTTQQSANVTVALTGKASEQKVDVKKLMKKDKEVRAAKVVMGSGEASVLQNSTKQTSAEVAQGSTTVSSEQMPKPDEAAKPEVASSIFEEEKQKPKTEKTKGFKLDSTTQTTLTTASESPQRTSNSDFVANFIVQPEFSQRASKRPKLEFVPHFEQGVFEFMIPEGLNQEDSLVAIIQFYDRVDSKGSPIFNLVNDTQQWFTIGNVNRTLEVNYSVDLIPILLKANVTVATSKAIPDDIYSIGVAASQDNFYNVADLRINILTLVPDSVEMADLILSRLNSVDDPKMSTFSDDAASSIDKVKSIQQNEEDKVVSDWFDDSNGTLKHVIDSSIEQEVVEVDYPDIKLELRGLVANTLSVSESLQNGMPAPDFYVHLSIDQPFDEVVELEISPDNVFALRPRFLLPNEQSQLIVINSSLLDFDKDPQPFELTISARFFKAKDKKSQVHEKLTVEKLDVADHAPQFEKPEYNFRVSESADNNTFIGHILALDEDVPSGHSDDSLIQYTLLGYGSQNFRIANGSLMLYCVQDFNADCLDYEQVREYNLLAIAVDQFGLSSEAVPLTIKVKDSNDNGPTLQMFDSEIEINDSEIRSPFLFAVNDVDTTKEHDNLVELSNTAASFLSLEQLGLNLYQVQVSRTTPVGLYHLDITARDARGENLSQKTRVRVNVLSSAPKVLFQRQHYERLVAAENLQTGTPIVQVELNGASNNIRFMIIDGNPGWLAVEEYSGSVYVSELPSQGVKPGKLSAKIAAVERDSQRILATTELQLDVHGSQQAYLEIFNKPLTTLFVRRDAIKSDLKVSLASNDADLKLVHVEAWNDDLLSVRTDQSSVRIEDGQLTIAKELLEKVNSVSVQLGSDGSNKTALWQIFSTRDFQKLQAADDLLTIPRFSLPWISEKLMIELQLQEELPLGHTILCLPASNQLDNSLVENVELAGRDSEYFLLDSTNSCILVQKRIDFEQMSPDKDLHLELYARLGIHTTQARIHLSVIDLDDNIPELQLLKPNKMPLELMENARVGEKLADILVLDKDYAGKNQHFRYKLSGLQSENFQIRVHEQNQSILMLNVAPGAQLDREQNEKILLKLTVTDQAGNFNDLPIKIHLLDYNDNRPQFIKSSSVIDVFDNWPVDLEIASFSAVDLDSGNNSLITYSLDQNADFKIDPSTGSIRIANSLTSLARPEPLTVSILAIDHGDPPQSSVAELQIYIHEATTVSDADVQEVRIISPPIDFQLDLEENLPAGYLVYKVEVVMGMLSDSSEGDVLHYSLEPIDSDDANWLSIDESTGDVHLLRSLDYEQQPYITDRQRRARRFRQLFSEEKKGDNR